jgi:hypothetical protein
MNAQLTQKLLKRFPVLDQLISDEQTIREMEAKELADSLAEFVREWQSSKGSAWIWLLTTVAPASFGEVAPVPPFLNAGRAGWAMITRNLKEYLDQTS